MIIQAISNYLTKQGIEHRCKRRYIEIPPQLPEPHNNEIWNLENNTILLVNHNLKTLNYTTLHLADPQLLPKLLKLL
jgi:hypothetical protein